MFRACKACHAVGKGAKNKVGPGLYKVLGAPIGSVAGFRYSKTFKKKAAAGEVWDAASLDAFMAKPLAWAKGTYMAFGGVRKASDRKALIEYLKSVGQE
ncbi:MAG: hypothetical protein MRY74_04820 [Neomegalonema sp.]|nr:hypothetical protein [Neomegalonema sp.]